MIISQKYLTHKITCINQFKDMSAFRLVDFVSIKEVKKQRITFLLLSDLI